MKITEERPSLLATVPGGPLLLGLLRLVLSAERRDEFLGDLVEEAILHLPAGTPQQLGGWLWAQTLRSLPSLLWLRLCRLTGGAFSAGARALTGSPPPGLLLAGARPHQRRLPLSLAVSVSTHTLLVVGVLGWLMSRVDEVEPTRHPLDNLWAAVLADPSDAGATPTESARPTEVSPARRLRPARRRAPPAPPPAAVVAVSPSTSTPLRGPASGGDSAILTSTAGAPTVPAWADQGRDRGAGSAAPERPAPGRAVAGQTFLPPRVAEKRCLSCPTPLLEPMLARIASGRHMAVRTCVSAAGRVSSVDIQGSFGRLIDDQVVQAVRSWRLIPYRVEGRPVPFCYQTRFLFTDH